MIYTFEFETATKDRTLLQLFTIVDKKVSIEVVNKAIAVFNQLGGFSTDDKYEVTSEKNRNILKFGGSKGGLQCTIQRAVNDQDVKSSEHYIYISETSDMGISAYDVVQGVRTYYDDNFCKCLIDMGNTGNKVNMNRIQVRYGKPFNGVFNSSINNREVQIRLMDGKLRFKPTSLE